MDVVLDTLLSSLRDLVPYDSATVFLAEEDSRLFVAREAAHLSANDPVVVLDLRDNSFLEQVLSRHLCSD